MVVKHMVMEKIKKYNEETEKLFSQWKNVQGEILTDDGKTIEVNHRDRVFISDGVVCPELWFSQEVRPLFLLKEAYGGKDDWDLIKDHLLSHRAVSKTWERICGWAKGLFITTDTDMPEFIKDDPEIAHYGNEYLKKIAVINIKKSDGKTSSSNDEIGAYAQFDRDRLMRQLEICDPTVIICGYTTYQLETVLDRKFRKQYNNNLWYNIPFKGHNVLVIDYWHPANRYPDIMNYYGLMGIYQQAIRTQ